MSIQVTQQGKYRLLQKIGSYFKIPQDKVKESVSHFISGSHNVESPVFEIDIEELGGEIWYPLVTTRAVNFTEVLNPDKLKKNPYYQAVEQAESYLQGEHEKHRHLIRVAIWHGGSSVWIARRIGGIGYQGAGGLYVKDTNSGVRGVTGFIMEPILNYLEPLYPPPTE